MPVRSRRARVCALRPHDEDTELVNKGKDAAVLRRLEMVGGDGIEPTASSVSRKRSPTELTAHGQRKRHSASIAKHPVAVKRFFVPAQTPFLRLAEPHCRTEGTLASLFDSTVVLVLL
jgi:hypothetical protein